MAIKECKDCGYSDTGTTMKSKCAICGSWNVTIITHTIIEEKKMSYEFVLNDERKEEPIKVKLYLKKEFGKISLKADNLTTKNTITLLSLDENGISLHKGAIGVGIRTNSFQDNSVKLRERK